MRRGATLLELATALAIVGVVAAVAFPALRSSIEEYAVRGARSALVAGIARARAAAIAHGGARFVADPAAGRIWVEVEDGDTIGRVVDLAADYGVSLDAGASGGARVALRFDGLGIGRLTSRTFTLTRGGAAARITVSAYGRVSP